MYECPLCECREEILELGSDKGKGHVCENCGKPMNRIPTASNFHLKGTGWYVTDYKSKGGGKKDKGD
jgi:predicted nucleic acid-binding Zn ribbon protein